MGRGRLEAFSDGVFAVAITLLALNLAVRGPGHGPLAHQLTHAWPSWVAYAISFFTIAIIWTNHHALFLTIERVDRVLVYINFVLLFFVVAIPFATGTMATYLQSGGRDARLATAVYCGVIEGMGLTSAALFLWVMRKGYMRVSALPGDRRRAALRFAAGSIAYIVAIGVAFASPVSAVVISGLVAAYYVFEQTPIDKRERDSLP
jgi:uncharacterized membrane protein